MYVNSTLGLLLCASPIIVIMVLGIIFHRIFDRIIVLKGPIPLDSIALVGAILLIVFGVIIDGAAIIAIIKGESVQVAVMLVGLAFIAAGGLLIYGFFKDRKCIQDIMRNNDYVEATIDKVVMFYRGGKCYRYATCTYDGEEYASATLGKGKWDYRVEEGMTVRLYLLKKGKYYIIKPL